MYSHLRIFALAIFPFWNATPSDGLEDFHGGSDGKESACDAGDAGDTGSIPGLGRSSGEGNGYPLQYSCLENSMGRGAWWATGGHEESDTSDQVTLSLSFTDSLMASSLFSLVLSVEEYPYQK